MSSAPVKRHRRSMRLKGYDYAQPGAYFVTICAQQREFLFGEIVHGPMCLNPAGEMVWRWWRELPGKYPQVEIDAAVVMPNHLHGIIMIVGKPCVGQPRRAAPTEVGEAVVGATRCGRPEGGGMDVGQPRRAAPTEVGDAVVGATRCGGMDVGQPLGAAPTAVGDAVVGATLCDRPDRERSC